MADMSEATVIVRQNADSSAEWWRGAVIYQIYPRSFRDTNGDGIGDLRGVLGGLEHIASLGVDGIWISPFFTSPMADFGYDVADFCDVDPIFGTLEDFDAVLKKAHGLGLKVIIDQVYSHTSDAHPWFAKSRMGRDGDKSDWYVWADPKPDGSPPNNWQSVFGGPSWEWDARRGQYYFHNFLKEQPDLNMHNREVQDAMIAVAQFWLDRGVDGFRLDALNFSMHDRQLRDNPPSGVSAEDATRPFDMQKHVHSMSQPEVVEFIERFRAVVDGYPDRFLVAEIGGPEPINEMKAFTAGEGRLNSAYNFDFLYAPSLTAERIIRTAEQWTQSPDEGWPSWAFSNHDAPRAISRWAPQAHREEMAKMSMMLLLTLRGNPIIYQGEELGLPQANVARDKLRDPEAIQNWPKTLGRDGARTPFPWESKAPYAGFSSAEPWLPVDPVHASLALNEQTGPHSMLAFTQRALSIRSDHQVLRTGRMEASQPGPEELLHIQRIGPGCRYIALFNLSDKEIALSEDIDLSGRIILTSWEAEPGSVELMSLPAYSAVWVACDQD